MSFNPGDLLAWIDAIKMLIELLKEIFGEQEGKELAKTFIRKVSQEA
mgnify:CR=1 FL=1